jgi:hypothetical protein
MIFLALESGSSLFKRRLLAFAGITFGERVTLPRGLKREEPLSNSRK